LKTPRKRRPRMPYLGIRDELTHHSFSIRDFYSDAEFAARCVAAPASLEALGERIAEKLANKDYFGRRAKKHLQSVLGSLFKEIKKRCERGSAL